MRSQLFAAAQLLLAGAVAVVGNPVAYDSKHNVTYHGLDRNGIEVFLNIKYGKDTSGNNRFKPPRPHVPSPGTRVTARSYGPACPQKLGQWVTPLSLTPVTEISEDCLNLNIARPKHVCPSAKLPVLIYMHGGSFWAGQNQEITITPDGMILESVKNGLPVIHVAMNYRLGFFGFAQSDALKSEVSENAGLRDQRLAIEWVRDNIAHFGGDPNKITIFGQSSGGLACGLHMLAYGGSKPIPFQQVICESQSLEPGITGNFTPDAMQLLVDQVGCNKSSLQSEETVKCLRNYDTGTLLNASIDTYQSDIAHNIGDIWLPVVDGDFLPAPPSQLINERRFAKNVTAMMGWTQDELTLFTDPNITTAAQTKAFLVAYLPDVTNDNIDKLLALYPVSEFQANKDANLSSEFYRTARIFRDILMVCEPIGYGAHLAAAGNTVYFYEWNQTILDPILTEANHAPGMGPIHTSEFAYIFGNLSHYDTNGYPFHPTKADYELKERGSRSWSTFASTGKPGLKGKNTFQGFEPAFNIKDEIRIFVVGGPHEGLSAVDGPGAHPAVREQKLKQRCAFINSPEFIEQAKY